MPSKHARIAELEETIERQAQTIKRLEERLCELELELARAKKDCSTSSKPPSSDIVNPPKPKKKRGRPKKRRKGGQPGHERRLREPLPPERVDETIEYSLDGAEVARHGLMLTGDFEIRPRQSRTQRANLRAASIGVDRLAQIDLTRPSKCGWKTSCGFPFRVATWPSFARGRSLCRCPTPTMN